MVFKLNTRLTEIVSHTTGIASLSSKPVQKVSAREVLLVRTYHSRFKYFMQSYWNQTRC